MTTKVLSALVFFGMAVGLAAACGGPAPTAYTVAPVLQEPPPVLEAPAPGQAGAGQRPEGQAAVLYRTGLEEVPSPSQRSDRLIIKSAEVKLLVADTDAAIDGVTQAIIDVGGYLIISRVWYREWGGQNYKYANLTFGVPAEEYERSLRRLRQLALRVIEEVSTGQDVTEEYVDLRSQLESLQATRARIMGFLDRARTVEEALTINDQLAAVDQQIEQVQGRINYLADRSAYSTITVSLEPELPEIVATATPTLTPTPTEVPWDPGATYAQAKGAVTSAYQVFADLLIWLAVAVLPVVAPPVVIVWLVWRLTRGKAPQPEGEDRSGG